MSVPSGLTVPNITRVTVPTATAISFAGISSHLRKEYVCSMRCSSIVVHRLFIITYLAPPFRRT